MKTPWGYIILGLAGAGLALTVEARTENGYAAFGLVLLGMAWLAGCSWVGCVRGERKDTLNNSQQHRLSLGREGAKEPSEAPEGSDGAEQGSQGQEGSNMNGFDYE